MGGGTGTGEEIEKMYTDNGLEILTMQEYLQQKMNAAAENMRTTGVSEKTISYYFMLGPAFKKQRVSAIKVSKTHKPHPGFLYAALDYFLGRSSFDKIHIELPGIKKHVDRYSTYPTVTVKKDSVIISHAEKKFSPAKRIIDRILIVTGTHPTRKGYLTVGPCEISNPRRGSFGHQYIPK